MGLALRRGAVCYRELPRILLLRGWVNKATTVRCMGWLGLSQLLILLHIGNLSAPNEESPLLPAVPPGRGSGGSQGIVLARLA
jgi:hypothetical protein